MKTAERLKQIIERLDYKIKAMSATPDERALRIAIAGLLVLNTDVVAKLLKNNTALSCLNELCKQYD